MQKNKHINQKTIFTKVIEHEGLLTEGIGSQ